MYPTLFSVYWSPKIEQADGLGNTTLSYGDSETVAVFGWHTGGADAASGIAPQRVIYDAVLYAPQNIRFHHGDRIELPGEGLFTVEGEPKRWANNPWFNPGMAGVDLKRVDAAWE